MRCLTIAAAVAALMICGCRAPLERADALVFGSASDDMPPPPGEPLALPLADEPGASDAPEVAAPMLPEEPPPLPEEPPPLPDTFEDEPPDDVPAFEEGIEEGIEEDEAPPDDIEPIPLPRDVDAALPASPVARMRARPRCCPPAAMRHRNRLGYVGGGPTAFPGLGFMVEGGAFLDRTCGAAIYAETGLCYQDLTDGFNGIDDGANASFMAWFLGVRVAFRPDSNLRPVLRTGVGWAHTSGLIAAGDDVAFGQLNGQEHTFGGYAGLGLESDVWSGRVTMGPELRFFVGAGTNDSDLVFAPMFIWHFVVNM
jgi:hypothetical protein